MKLIKEILGRIFAIWAILLFVATMLIVMIPLYLYCLTVPDPKRNSRFIKLSRIWMNVYLPLIGCPLRVKGKEHFVKGESYVVACNHNSLMDVPISTPAIPGGNKTIAKIAFAKFPLFGTIYKTGSVLVDRKSDQSRKESYSKMKDTLAMGLHMCLYPEGTRNLTDQPLKSFHNGAFKLSIETGRSIMPGIIFNTKKVLPPSKAFYLMPHRLRIDFLPPVSPLPGESTEAFRDRIWLIMEKHYAANA